MKYAEVSQSYGFSPFSTFNRGVFSQPCWEDRQPPPRCLSFRGVPAVPTAPPVTFAGVSVLHCSQRCTDCPLFLSRGTLLHRQVIGKVPCTLCSLQVLSNAINPPSISQGVASTSNAHWKHHMLQLQVFSPAAPRLWPWVLPYWQIGTSHCHSSPRLGKLFCLRTEEIAVCSSARTGET